MKRTKNKEYICHSSIVATALARGFLLGMTRPIKRGGGGNTSVDHHPPAAATPVGAFKHIQIAVQRIGECQEEISP